MGHTVFCSRLQAQSKSLWWQNDNTHIAAGLTQGCNAGSHGSYCCARDLKHKDKDGQLVKPASL